MASDLQNRTVPEIEEALGRAAFEQPAFGRVRVGNEFLKQEHQVSPAGVRGASVDAQEPAIGTRDPLTGRRDGQHSPG